MHIILEIYEKILVADQYKFLGITATNLLGSILLFLFFVIFKRTIKKLFIKKISIISRLKNKEVKDVFLSSLEKPVEFFVLTLGFFSASNLLDAPEKIDFFFDKINLSLFTIFIFWIINKIIEPLSHRIKNIESILTKDLLDWIISATKILVFVLGFSAVLELWGIRVGPIIAGLGLFGVAVALGAQDLFKNLISGILVLVEKRFKKNDVILIEKVVEGTVEKIGFRSTAIRKFDKSLCFIPNYQFAENPVTNITQISNRRINWIIGLEYKSTVNQLREICKDIEKYIEKSKENFFVSGSTPVIVKINEFAPSSIDILVRCFTKTNDYKELIEIKDKLAIKIKEIVEKRKCGFAFPTQSLYIEKQI
jgi:MscS family membrane protein